MPAFLTDPDPQALAQLCSKLVKINSINPPGNETRLAEYCARYLEDLALEVSVINHGQNRSSLLARLPGKGNKPGVLFSAHLDTVPPGLTAWEHDPLSGLIADGNVYGRGAADMKGGMAVILYTVSALKAGLEGDIYIALTAGEETDSLGAKVVADRLADVPLQGIIIPEPTHNQVVIAEKGALWLELTTFGKTAHGSTPGVGVNAIEHMRLLLNEWDALPFTLPAHPLLGEFTRSLNTIQGGVKTNVVPDQCTVSIDMRTLPGQDHAEIFRQVEALIEKLSGSVDQFKATVVVSNDRPPVMTDPHHPFVVRFNQAAETATGTRPAPRGMFAFTDGSILAPRLKLPLVVCGPGQPNIAHQPDEYVEISQLTESAKILLQALTGLLSA